MAGPKDDESVLRFMALYHKLIEWTDDDPAHVGALVAQDQDFVRICVEFGSAASVLSNAESHGRRRFAVPVDPKFIQAWRDYEVRWADLVQQVLLVDLLGFEPNLDVSEQNGKSGSNALQKQRAFAAPDELEMLRLLTMLRVVIERAPVRPHGMTAMDAKPR